MTAAHNSYPSSCIFLLGFLTLANYPLWRGIFKNAQACLPPLCLLGPEETLPSHTVASLLLFHSMLLWPCPSFHIIQRSTRCWSLCPYKLPTSKNFLNACAYAMTVTLDLLTSSAVQYVTYPTGGWDAGLLFLNETSNLFTLFLRSWEIVLPPILHREEKSLSTFSQWELLYNLPQFNQAFFKLFFFFFLSF